MQIRRTQVFNDWLLNLRDRQGRAKIYARIDRLEDGNPGNSRSVGAGVIEMKIDFGPGYRIYFCKDGDRLVILLGGGTKKRQHQDIENAKAAWREYKQLKKNALKQAEAKAAVKNKTTKRK